MAETQVDRKRLIQLRGQAGLLQEEVADRAGIDQSTLSNLESGRRTTARLSTLAKIAKFYNVPVESLLSREPGPAHSRVELRLVPVIGTVPGGEPQLVEQQAGESIYVDETVLANIRRPYGLHVTGDSMFPGIRDGDYIVVDPDALWQPNDVVVALVGAETTVKRIQLIDGRPMLVADNGHGVIDPAGQDVHVVGVVVWVQPQGWKP